MIGQIAKGAGLEHLEIHPHKLCYSWGYALINKRTDTRIIQGYLGHGLISSTVRYTNLDRTRLANCFKNSLFRARNETRSSQSALRLVPYDWQVRVLCAIEMGFRFRSLPGTEVSLRLYSEGRL